MSSLTYMACVPTGSRKAKMRRVQTADCIPNSFQWPKYRTFQVRQRKKFEFSAVTDSENAKFQSSQTYIVCVPIGYRMAKMRRVQMVNCIPNSFQWPKYQTFQARQRLKFKFSAVPNCENEKFQSSLTYMACVPIGCRKAKMRQVQTAGCTPNSFQWPKYQTFQARQRKKFKFSAVSGLRKCEISVVPNKHSMCSYWMQEGQNETSPNGWFSTNDLNIILF
jgi:hypothetical protein